MTRIAKRRVTRIVVYIFLLASAAAAFLLGGMANPLYALLIAYTNDFLEHEDMAAASGGLIFINGSLFVLRRIFCLLLDLFFSSYFFFFFWLIVAHKLIHRSYDRLVI